MSARDEALLHPVRMRIIQVLASGEPCTARQLDDILSDVPQTSLYRHLGRLVEVGLLEVIGERPVRGSVEKTYALATSALPPGAPDATAEDHFRSFLSVVAAQLGSVSRYLDQGAPDLAADGVAWSAVPAWLSDDELVELREVVTEMLSRPASPGRRQRLIAFSTLPLLDEPDP
ncbi:MAG: DNA-binding transcriptional ArsR family regulator [Myxococcota bacterium]|jgi:DNA-binding transcriptional ArsR family regulator